MWWHAYLVLVIGWWTLTRKIFELWAFWEIPIQNLSWRANNNETCIHSSFTWRCTYMYMYTHTDTEGGEINIIDRVTDDRSFHSLFLLLVSLLTWKRIPSLFLTVLLSLILLLRTKFMSSCRIASTLKHWVKSLASSQDP